MEALVKEDSKKLGELAEVKVKLEKLLEEETQAKRLLNLIEYIATTETNIIGMKK